MQIKLNMLLKYRQRDQCSITVRDERISDLSTGHTPEDGLDPLESNSLNMRRPSSIFYMKVSLHLSQVKML